MKKKSIFAYFAIVAIINLAAACSAWAHRVNVFAWVDGDTVHTRSKFSGGNRVKGGKILVSGPEAKVLLEGITDENGEFSFTIPQKTELNIELLAGTGHRGRWVLTRREVEAGSAGETQKDSRPEKEPDLITEPLTKQAPSGLDSKTNGAAGLTEKQMEKAMERALDKKLEPVMETLSKIASPGPKPSDIFGGIGYILGLVGLAAYVRFKKAGK